MALAIKLNRVRHIIRVSSFLAESLDLFHQFLVDRVLQQVDLCPLGAIAINVGHKVLMVFRFRRADRTRFFCIVSYGNELFVF